METEKKRRLEFLGDGFTTVFNSLVRDENLSLKARGLMLWIQSHNPDKFKFSKGSFVNISKKDGMDSINSAIKELKTNGYLEIKRVKSESGQFNWIYIFNKGGSKLDNSNTTIPDLSIHGKSIHGSSIDGKPTHIRKNNKEINIPINAEQENFLPIDNLKIKLDELKKSIPGYKPMFESQELLAYRHLLENGFDESGIINLLHKLFYIRNHESKDSEFYRKNSFSLRFLVGNNYQKIMLEQMVNLYEVLKNPVVYEKKEKQQVTYKESKLEESSVPTLPVRKKDEILFGVFTLHPDNTVTLPDGNKIGEKEFLRNQISYALKYKKYLSKK